jgi:hypothetical protein
MRRSVEPAILCRMGFVKEWNKAAPEHFDS